MPVTRVGDLDVAWDISGADDAEPVLMVNGLGADHTAWYLQVPAFSETFRVVTYDNRDVGETGPGDHPRPYGIRQFADDAAGLLDALDIPRAHIVGASMGGAIAQEFALAYPARTMSVTIVCSWPRTDPWLAELWERWERVFAGLGALEWARTSWLWVFTHRYYDDPRHLAALVASVETASHPQTFAMYERQSRAAAGHDTRDRLGGITAPAHVIVGEADIFTPPRYAKAIAAAIAGARLSIVPDVGHGLFWEATDDFNALVLDFLRAHRGA